MSASQSISPRHHTGNLRTWLLQDASDKSGVGDFSRCNWLIVIKPAASLHNSILTIIGNVGNDAGTLNSVIPVTFLKKHDAMNNPANIASGCASSSGYRRMVIILLFYKYLSRHDGQRGQVIWKECYQSGGIWRRAKIKKAKNRAECLYNI